MAIKSIVFKKSNYFCWLLFLWGLNVNRLSNFIIFRLITFIKVNNQSKLTFSILSNHIFTSFCEMKSEKDSLIIFFTNTIIEVDQCLKMRGLDLLTWMPFWWSYRLITRIFGASKW